ncbi:MAG TPA: TIGR03032 family protein, partial [bacterium]|nr:TIGR03032 family protein [bacterium]
HEVVVLEDAPQLAPHYPRQPGTYDHLYVPRAVYFTGRVDLHDLAWSGDTLWGVNTVFSCLCTIDARHSFRPEWRPPFVTAIAPEDRCHLNGVAMADGKPVYVTALGATDSPRGWKEGALDGGVVVHVPSGEIVLDSLAMPHSPRLVDGRLWFVASATGEVHLAEPGSGKSEVVAEVPGFARGLTVGEEHVFVGHSRIRKDHLFGDLPVARREHSAGVVAIHRETGRVDGALRYETSCEEIYDVQLIPGRRPGILGVLDDVHRRALVTPETAYWAADPDPLQPREREP